MGNFSPFSFARLGRDAIDLIYGRAIFVADFNRGLYRTKGQRRATLIDAVQTSRATTANVVEDDRLRTVAANAAVIQKASGEAMLRIEPQATNIIHYSDDMTSDEWSIFAGGSATVSYVSGAGFGGAPASVVTCQTSDAGIFTIVAATAGESRVLSYLWKPGTRTSNTLGVYDESNSQWVVGPSDSTAYRTSLGDGWFRISVPYIVPFGCSTLRLYPDRAGGSATPGSTFTLMGLQDESGLVPTSLIQTDGGMATRAADVVTAAAPIAAGSFHVTVVFTLTSSQSSGSFNRVVEIFGPDGSGVLQVHGASGQLRMLTLSASSPAASLNLGAAEAGTRQAVVMVFDGANSKGLLFGAQVKPLDGHQLSSLAILALGSGNGASGQPEGSLLISNISMGEGALSDGEMYAVAGGLL